MRAIWKGNISFALVGIPLSVFSATRSSDVSFKYLHKKDLSKVSYKRFCEAEDKEVPWEEITRGYEYEKDRFVEITDEALKRPTRNSRGRSRSLSSSTKKRSILCILTDRICWSPRRVGNGLKR